MQFKRFGVMLAAAAFAAGVFADAANVLISFSTKADYYADGETPVRDGEWYALCWSANATFSGLDLNCEPIDKNDRVLVLAPLAKDGRCPYVVFQVDSKKAPTGGNYFVYLLDTRDVEGKPSKAAVGRRIPANVVNGSAKVDGFTASATTASVGNVSGANVAATTASATGSSVAVSDWQAVKPKITAFVVNGSTVDITVTGIMGGVEYEVVMGQTPSKLESYELPTQSGTGTIEFIDIPVNDAKFFSVVGK